MTTVDRLNVRDEISELIGLHADGEIAGRLDDVLADLVGRAVAAEREACAKLADADSVGGLARCSRPLTPRPRCRKGSP